MFLKAYSLFDNKTGIFSAPFFLIHDSLAVRAIQQSCYEKQTQYSQYPADFILYRVGEFDDNTSQYNSIPPSNLGTVATLLSHFERDLKTINAEQNK